MNEFLRDYVPKYDAMRAAATRVEGPLLAKLIEVCQTNAWLRVGGCDFEPEGFCVESDYPYGLERYDDLDMLEAFFQHGNWGIRAAVQYQDLIFVNQVNAGDEWWTLKIDGDRLVPFESITMRGFVGKRFKELIRSLHEASVEMCVALEYNAPGKFDY